MSLAPGTTIGRYRIIEPLGQGGMATVYRAFQPALERTVALKVIRPGLAEDPEFLTRFQREAKAVAQLEHPNIVQVFDFDEADGRYFMAMQHLEGGTLKGRLAALAERGQRLAPRDVARIVSEVAAGLAYAHAQGVLHRDVKPSNILFSRDGRAVVSDFGIAKIVGGTQLTQTGVGIGTPEYMSPEQGRGGEIDHRSDVYSLGVLAYELLAGRVPFIADTPFAVVAAHMRDPVPLPSRLAPQVGPATERVLLKALAKDPADRYASTTELAEALAHTAAERAPVTLPTVPVRGSKAARPVPTRAPFASAARDALPAITARARGLTLTGLAALSILAAVGAVLLAGGGTAVIGLFGGALPGSSAGESPPAGPRAALREGSPSAPTTPAATEQVPTPTSVPTPAATARVVASVRIVGRPVALAANPSTNRIYVATEGQELFVIDGSRDAVASRVAVDRDPVAVAVDHTADRIYVGHLGNVVSVIDGARNVVVATISMSTEDFPGSRSPVGVDVNPTTNRLYVTHHKAGLVSVIDTSRSAVVRQVAVDAGPIDVAVNPTTGRVYVAHTASRQVSVIDGSRDTVVATVPVAASSSAVSVDPTRDRIYVAHPSPGLLSVIDGSRDAVVATVAVGVGANDVAVDPSTNRIYVLSETGEVSVVDGSRNVVVAKGSVGGLSFKLAVNPATKRTYVAAYLTDSVIVLME